MRFYLGQTKLLEPKASRISTILPISMIHAYPSKAWKMMPTIGHLYNKSLHNHLQPYAKNFVHNYLNSEAKVEKMLLNLSNVLIRQCMTLK